MVPAPSKTRASPLAGESGRAPSADKHLGSWGPATPFPKGWPPPKAAEPQAVSHTQFLFMSQGRGKAGPPSERQAHPLVLRALWPQVCHFQTPGWGPRCPKGDSAPSNLVGLAGQGLCRPGWSPRHLLSPFPLPGTDCGSSCGTSVAPGRDACPAPSDRTAEPLRMKCCNSHAPRYREGN